MLTSRRGAAFGAQREEPQVAAPARGILVAAGTQPNTVLAREDPLHVELDGRYFQALDEDGNKVTPQRVAKPDAAYVLMSLAEDGPRGQLFGDLHPELRGQCRQGDGRRDARLSGRQPHTRPPRPLGTDTGSAKGAARRRAARPGAHEVIRLTPRIIEVVVRAPLTARAFQPGQFYRLRELRDLRREKRGYDPGDGGDWR